ncbi:putative gustatory receptor 39b [Schistocerca piceifrons]|uniref:putative gustatory receptor 39b n=1 Tax=Schistocerca piceifrons TaxID=274613 RepID=UPI001F5F0EB8|nr:putative gustatory receptor 39b [Schistocerca piceifrons]
MEYRSISDLITFTYIITDILPYFQSLLTTGLCIVTDYQKLRRYFNQIKYTDAHLMFKKEDNMKMLGGFLLAVHLAVAVAIFATSAQNSYGMYSGPLMIHFLLSDCLTTLQFVLLELELWVRFRSLNSRLTEVIPACLTPVSLHRPIASFSPPPGRLHQLLEAYMSLYYAEQLLQDHFGGPVAISVAQSVSCSTRSAYEVLLKQLKPKWTSQLHLGPSVSNTVMWLTFHWLRLSTVALSCAAVEQEAAATIALFLKASVASEGHCPELEAFLPLLVHSPPLRFSAAGFFTVDRRVLVSALAIVITYVVIMAQVTSAQ